MNFDFSQSAIPRFALTTSLRLRAFAKINLLLKVRGRRPDGYHEILTVYQTIGLHDRLTLSLLKTGKTIHVQCADPAVPSGRRNLIYQACELWRRAREYRGGIEVSLEKRIPTGAGLGGGSSDAAAALLGLERLTGDRLNSHCRQRLAARLGSDVPLFLWGGRVLGCGRGEEVYPLWDLPRRYCLVAFPGFSVSTAEAYREVGRSLRLTISPKRSRMVEFGAWPRYSLDSWGPAENDFERVVFARWPELAQVKTQLIQAGAETASLTGSGSAVFAVFDSALKLARASKFLSADWRIFRTRTLPRDEYERKVWD